MRREEDTGRLAWCYAEDAEIERTQGGRMKQMARLLALACLPVFLAGCYFNETVETSRVAVKTDGGRIVDCVGSGLYTDLGFFADLKQISRTATTFVVDDKEVATRDTQLVGITATVQVQRKSDCESLKNLVTNWSTIAFDDKALQTVVDQTVLQGVKVGARTFTLEQLLDDRTGLAQHIRDALEPQAARFSVEVLSVQVNNVAIDEGYAQQLRQKALLTAQIETEKRRQDLIKQQGSNEQLQRQQDTLVLQEQLKKEEAQTTVNLEIANRTGKVTAAQNAVYSQNPQAFELERLRLLKDVLGDKSVVYFIPAGASLNLFLGSLGGGAVPVPITGTVGTK